MFPFSSPFHFAKNISVNASEVHDYLKNLLTMDRLSKIQKVVDARTFQTVVVLENIYDRGNASAVMRSAEALGFGQMHMIETSEKFKESQRTTAGADKWVEVQRWPSTLSCIEKLKSEGKQIVVTHLDETSRPISEIDFSKPTAFVLGNEKEGVSREMIQSADHRVLLPMVGFVQSYNISVAAALGLYHIYMDRIKRLGQQGDLSEEEKIILRAVYYLRTQPSGEDLLRETKLRLINNK